MTHHRKVHSLHPQLCRTAILTAALLGAFVGCLASTSSANADAPASADHALLLQLAARLNADESTIAQLKGQLAARPSAATPAASSTTYGPFTVTGKDVYLTGYNLHIQSGSGSTTATPNGLGNLIIGYNEAPSSPKRTGSHNLILGTQNNYSSYGGIVAGNGNTASGIYATVVGGRDSTASGSYSCIAGGYKNTTSTIYTVAAGPMSTTALTTQGNDGNNHSGYLVTFTGANLQIENGLGATDGEPNNHEDVTNYVTNGLGNLIIGYNETQASLGQGDGDYRVGSHNLILGDYNEYSGFGGMVGASFNTMDGAYSSVIAGGFNEAGSADTAILGGEYNTTTSSFYATVSGGEYNFATGEAASISGGADNTASGAESSVFGGDGNTASGTESSVTGDGNTASGSYSCISGGTSITESNEDGWAAVNAPGATYSGNFRSP